jgi:hypothetical protein
MSTADTHIVSTTHSGPRHGCHVLVIGLFKSAATSQRRAQDGQPNDFRISFKKRFSNQPICRTTPKKLIVSKPAKLSVWAFDQTNETPTQLLAALAHPLPSVAQLTAAGSLQQGSPNNDGLEPLAGTNNRLMTNPAPATCNSHCCKPPEHCATAGSKNTQHQTQTMQPNDVDCSCACTTATVQSTSNNNRPRFQLCADSQVAALSASLDCRATAACTHLHTGSQEVGARPLACLVEVVAAPHPACLVAAVALPPAAA